jgi:transcriptional regulator with XRE-family HTH domain
MAMKKELVPELENNREVQMLYEEEGLVLEVTEAICKLLQKFNIKRSELARKLGVDKSYITQLLDGSSNMTLKTISDVLFCLDSRAKIKLEPVNEQIDDFTDSFEPSEVYHYSSSRSVLFQKYYDNQSRLAG